jgi:hypothetical protein
MCIFSPYVSTVASTKIFARSATGGRQFLVYAMQYSASVEVAMILPLPVPSFAPEDAVHFIDLSGYAEFFDDLAKGFILPQPARLYQGPVPRGIQPLAVQQVGSFEASFVPQLADFSRLDRRFRLPERTWEQLPQYAHHGFAVFKLKEGARKVHPMAFEFPRRNPNELFFPTVHVHDGKVKAKARFDHLLYCQTPQQQKGWLISSDAFPPIQPSPASQFMDIAKSQGILDADEAVQMQNLFGMLPNEDVVVLEQ